MQEKSQHRLTIKHAHEAVEQLSKTFDPKYGGFGQAPKFAQPQNILFLLKYHYFTGESSALTMAEKSLQYRDGETKYNGYLDDYAFLIWAYLELYQAEFNLTYLKKATQLMDDLIDLFWDEQHGGFYLSGKDGEPLISKDKEVYDGDMPSGNSVAVMMLTQLGELTGKTAYLDKAAMMYSTFLTI